MIIPKGVILYFFKSLIPFIFIGFCLASLPVLVGSMLNHLYWFYLALFAALLDFVIGGMFFILAIRMVNQKTLRFYGVSGFLALFWPMLSLCIKIQYLVSGIVMGVIIFLLGGDRMRTLALGWDEMDEMGLGFGNRFWLPVGLGIGLCYAGVENWAGFGSYFTFLRMAAIVLVLVVFGWLGRICSPRRRRGAVSAAPR